MAGRAGRRRDAEHAIPDHRDRLPVPAARPPTSPASPSFAGKVIHTTAWDDDYDLDGRRIAIIGTGATAVQLIPELAKRAAELTVYQRTPIWVVPKLDFRFVRTGEAVVRPSSVDAAGLRWLSPTPFYEFMVSIGVGLHHRAFARLNIAAADLSKMHRFVSIRDKELRAEADPGLRLRL